ncbi:Dyp-type peroxidase [Ottowia thiooxydans]|uniref:Dyp-type peroxidase n=1 Tax=Ottowia thiooxydans TaxID=219182 RepID=UPI000410684C|nr:Dyp-type peroxidase [Ottowia thiooxydans]
MTDPSTSPEPQAVADSPGVAAYFIVLDIAPGAPAEEAVRAFLGNAAGLRRSVGKRLVGRELSLVVGIGSSAWDRLFGAPRPAALHPFKALSGDKHHAPSTPGDLLLHIRARTEDMCFELATQIMQALGAAVQPVDEVHGFRYFDARSMVGFVDGTENPEGAEAHDATVIGGEDPGFEGGSYVIVQKYLHNMQAWNKLSTEEQERVIGRTKADDIELADDVKPTNSHVALNVVEDEDGNELAILRSNMAFAAPSRGEFGTYFIAYANNPSVTELMLTNMFIGRPPGNYDRLLDFSTAVTGTLFFVPSQALLEALADGNPLKAEAEAELGAAPGASSASDASPDDMAGTSNGGTLSIGSLRGQPQLDSLLAPQKGS